MGIAFQDYYETLGVPRTATDKEIKTAYRKLARQWHPDLHTVKDKEAAEEKFKQINEAYNVLSEPEKRAKYDRLGANWQAGEEFRPPPDMDGFQYYTYSGGLDGFGPAGEGFSGAGAAGGFSDFFEALFGGRSGSRGNSGFGATAGTGRRYGPVRGRDVEAELEISLEEAYHGVEKLVRLSSHEICSACGGSGYLDNSFCARCGGAGTVAGNKSLAVKIPAGVHDGSRIRLKGQGGEGLNGGPRGDLYGIIRLLPHALYKVDGNDLETEITLYPEQAVTGDQIAVPTLDGPVHMKVPAGTRAGKRLRLRGKGLPHKGGRGDQYVRIKIDIPETLTAEEENLYRQLAALRKGAVDGAQ